MSFWARTPERYMAPKVALSGAAQFLVQDVYDAIREVVEWGRGQTAVVANIVLDEAEDMKGELEAQTPFDPDGPNDPPLHASESWRMRVENRSEKILVSISNPKFYIGWLEERGGRPDHPGSNEPGWISDAFENFALGLRGRI